MGASIVYHMYLKFSCISYTLLFLKQTQLRPSTRGKQHVTFEDTVLVVADRLPDVYVSICERLALLGDFVAEKTIATSSGHKCQYVCDEKSQTGLKQTGVL